MMYLLGNSQQKTDKLSINNIRRLSGQSGLYNWRVISDWKFSLRPVAR